MNPTFLFLSRRTVALALLAIGLSACGGEGGTTIGNPVITIESASYANSASLSLPFDRWLGITPAFAAAVTEFRFCVTKLRMTNSDGNPVTQNGSASIEAILGLIDVSGSGNPKRWGSFIAPVNFILKQLDVELHLDPENCSGANYSMRYNGAALTKDLEFHFSFSPAVSIAAGDTLILGLTPIATALEQAATDGKFNNEQIGEYLTTSTLGSGAK
ncbi:MAG: hypothetical protein NDJ89_13985 [Oligoflexia bacterium]|nr:hypothetical protein [Oligoflexia bacterium]